MKDDYAFPRTTHIGEKAPGMELRDWFAGIALQGMLANPSRIVHGNQDTSTSDYAQWAYETADAVMAERSK